MIFTNPVVLSVLSMIILCLLNLNVIIAILVAALVGGLASGMTFSQTMNILISGMGGNSETAISYILLGALAVIINKSGLANILSLKISKIVKNKKVLFLFMIGILSCLSQNLIPVHIAFIPILIPPLLKMMNKMKLDRRGVACALTFGLKAPYVMLPVGFGLIFHNVIRDNMILNSVEVQTNMVWKALFIPGCGMILGFLVAVLFSYRKDREYKDLDDNEEEIEIEKLNKNHYFVLFSAVIAFFAQLYTKSLPLGAIFAIVFLMVFRIIKVKDLNEIMHDSINMMGFIAFVMLVASGFAQVLRETGAVEALVLNISSSVGSSKVFGSMLMLLVGLFVTMGIGTSFGTIPILATIYCPLATSLGFSSMGIIALIGVAGALGDAGSPASDSTLGPTSGLNVDDQHDHIFDTCVPTFMHYNIPLLIFGFIASIIL